MSLEANRDFAEFDKPREKCGIVGIYGQNANIGSMTIDALSQLQHRGDQAAGITIFNGKEPVTVKDYGEVDQVFDQVNLSALPEGNISVAHVRYQTVQTDRENDFEANQPIETAGVAVVFNGNFTHFDGQPFLPNGHSDSVRFAEIVTECLDDQLLPYLPYAVRDAAKRSDGAFSLVVADKHNLVAIRDKRGFRPLVYGQKTDGSYVVASESVALDALDVSHYQHLGRGEMLVINQRGAEITRYAAAETGAFCMMELVYFSRPDTMYGAESVDTKRERTGVQLAIEAPADVDVVLGVPGTGLAAAKGYAEQLGLPFKGGGIHKIGSKRSFIRKTDEERRQTANKKFNLARDVIDGQRVAVIDDSLIRGTVTSVIVEKLRKFGAKEVHFRVASPRYINTCHFGIDTGREEELIARQLSIQETADFIGADSLEYLSLDGLKQALKYDLEDLCDACVTGNYPVPVKIGKVAIT